MVGGEHQHESIAVAFCRQHGGHCDGRARVASHRLEHDVGFDAALAQLLGNYESEVRVSDHERTGEQFGIGNAIKHLLKRRAFADQPDELLGHAFARDRPQPCSSPAAHDHRDNGKRH